MKTQSPPILSFAWLATCMLFSSATVRGVVLDVEPLPGERVWMLPGGEQGGVLAGGSSATVEIEVPDFTEREKEIGGKWRGILSLDAYGTVNGRGTALLLEALDSENGEVLARMEGSVSGVAPRADWAVIASSEHPGAAAERLFDGDPATDWHSRYGDDGAEGPHWVGLEFGAPRVLKGLRYIPRRGGGTNGVAQKYRVEVRRPGEEEWKTVSRGTSGNEVARDRGPVEVKFSNAREIEAFRFVIESDWSGGGFGTGGEIELLGIELPEKSPPVVAASRTWLELPHEMMSRLAGGKFVLRVRVKDGPGLVAGAPRFCRVHEAPVEGLYGRSNGGSGPDKLGAGLLGFDALTEHRQNVLTVMQVREGSPAAKAKLEAGDAIVAVSGRPLPVNDLNPGWDWFYRSHEAWLGRAAEGGLKGGQRALVLTVLREGKPVDLKLELPRGKAFDSMDPETDPEAAALLKDMLGFLERTQRDDGSWSGDIIRTTFSALALLAVEDGKYEKRVKKAIDWSLAKYPEPEKYGNLGFWHGAYAGILYSEWHLQSGDDRVLKHLEALRDWAVNGQHASSWGVPALGHGPSGLPYDNKSLVAPACHLLVYEALALRCGMESGIWELLMPYMEMAWSDPEEGGHGSLGYNRSYKDTEEFWSRSGLFAMAAHLRGERTDMRDAMTGFMAGRHPWFRNSHAYGEPGGALGLLALNLTLPEAYREIIREYGWWFSLAWEPGYGLRFTQPHMGAPYMGEDDLLNAVYALVLQGQRRTLHLTGRGESDGSR